MHINRSSHKYFFRDIHRIDFINYFIKYFDKRRCGVKNAVYKIKKLHGIIGVSWRQVYYRIRKRTWIITHWDLLKSKYRKGGKRKIGDIGRVFNKYIIPYGLRPKYIDDREEFGHWEMDLVMGQKTNGNQHILTLVERKTRYGIALKVPSKNPFKLNSVLHNYIQKEKLQIKSITIDNGREFEKISYIASLNNFKVYICEPFCSFQRGTNENWNGLFRRYFKKGTIFNNYSDEDIEHVANLINTTEREMFDYRSSAQFYLEEIKK